MVRIYLKPSAVRELESLPRPIAEAFREAITEMRSSRSATRLRLDVQRLRGTRTLWRLRVGPLPYRGVYRLVGNEVEVLMFGHRGQIYRRLPRTRL